MAKKSAKHPHRLIVEGRDTHAIIHLTQAHGADFADPDSFAPYVQEGLGARGEGGEDQGGVSEALTGFVAALKAPGMKRVGLVLDADVSPENRWASVRDRLQGLGIALPAAAPAEGWISETPLGPRAGVWVMPDNRFPGRLEELVAQLIPDGDPCIAHARASVAEALARGAPFREVDRLKAELHTWLAWRPRPGVPFGTAILARYLSPHTPAALAFCGWFMRLYRD